MGHILALIFAVTTAFAQEQEGEEIVVTARNPCALSTIKKELDHTHKPFRPDDRPQVSPHDDFDGREYSLSCRGQPECRGHIFHLGGASVTIATEPTGATFQIRGDAYQCKKNPDFPELNRNCRYERRTGERVIACSPDTNPGDPTCRFDNFERRIFLSKENIVNANQQKASVTCEPGRCQAYILNNHRNNPALYGNPDQDVLIVRKDRNGVETAQLIVNSSTVSVYADDSLNVDKGRNKFKPCPVNNGATVKRRRQPPPRARSGAR